MSQEYSVESPCVSVCKLVDLDGDDVCCGCGRSVDEIMQWREAGNERRLEILEAASTRRLAIKEEGD